MIGREEGMGVLMFRRVLLLGLGLACGCAGTQLGAGYVYFEEGVAMREKVWW